MFYRNFYCNATPYESQRRHKRDISHILKNAKRPTNVLDVFNEEDRNNLSKILDPHLHFKTGKESKNQTENTTPTSKATENLKSTRQILGGITIVTNPKANGNTNNTETDLSSLKEMLKTFWDNHDKVINPRVVPSKLEDKKTKTGMAFDVVTETSIKEAMVIEKNYTTKNKENQIKKFGGTRPSRPHKCPSPSHPRN